MLRDDPAYHEQHDPVHRVRARQRARRLPRGLHLPVAAGAGPAAALYIRVDWPESLRKNRRRYNPDRPDCILQHALEDKKIEMLYKESDWDEFAADPKFLPAGDRRVPYAVFENMPEKTDQPDVLGAHLEEVLNKLWTAWQEVKK